MNPNGTHDRELLEQIENRLEKAQPAGNPLLDELATTVPQARPDFQRDLEEQLIAHLHPPVSLEGADPMTTLTTVSQKPIRPLALPLTLVAAVLAMTLVGSLLLSVGSKPSNSNLSVLAQPSNTPTAAPTVIPTPTPFNLVLTGAGDCAEFKAQQLQAVQTQITDLQNHQNDLVAVGATLIAPAEIDQNRADMQAAAQELQQAQSLYAQIEASCGSGVNSSALSGELRMAISIPMSAVHIQLNQIGLTNGNTTLQLNEGSLTSGDSVDVMAALLFVNADPSLVYQAPNPLPSATLSASNIVVQRLLQNVPVVQISDAPLDNSTPQPTVAAAPSGYITLAVTAEEKAILGWALQAKIPLTLARSSAPEADLKPVVIARQSLPAGTQINLNSLTLAYWPANLVSAGIVADPSAFVGKYLSTALEAGQPVTAPDLSDNPQPTAVALTPAPDNRVNVSVPINSIQSVAVAIQDGDYVDVLAGIIFCGKDEGAQLQTVVVQPPTCPDSVTPQMVVNRMIQNAQVVHVGAVPVAAGMPQPTSDSTDSDTVTLSVTSQEAIVINWAVEAKLALTLVHVDSPPNVKPVVIARQFLPRGTQLSESSFIIAYWPASLVPDGIEPDPSVFVGKYLNAALEAGQPVTDADVTVQAVYNGPMTVPGIIGRDILREAITGIPANLKTGDSVDLTISFLNEHWSADTQQATGISSNTLVPPDGLVSQKVVFKGLYVANPDSLPNGPDAAKYKAAVSIYWSYADEAMFGAILDSHTPIAVTLTRSGDTPDSLQAAPVSDGKVSIFLPASSLASELILPRDLPLSANAQILAHLTTFTHLPDPTANETFESQDVTQIVIPDAQIANTSAAGYEMTISADELPALEWFIQAGIPLTVAT